MPRSSARLAFAGLFCVYYSILYPAKNVNNLKEICVNSVLRLNLRKRTAKKLRLAALFMSFPKTQKGAFLCGERGTAARRKDEENRKERLVRSAKHRQGRLENGKRKKQGRTKRKRAAPMRRTGTPVRSRTGTAKKKRAQRRKNGPWGKQDGGRGVFRRAPGGRKTTGAFSWQCGLFA